MQTIKIRVWSKNLSHGFKNYITTYLSQPPFFWFYKKRNTNDVIVLLEYKNGIKLVYANGYKRRCYPILADFIVDYKEQVLITGIKANMQYSICHIPSKKEN